MGADGQLPDLVVQEAKQKEERQEKREGTNPLLLVLALCFSVGISVVMLFVPTGALQQESKGKEQARRALVEYYIGKEPPFELYQLRLREALHAENAGDPRTARRKYREVLDMLHAEATGGRDWLTGPTYENINHRPNDRDLEELLTTLLSDG